VDSEKPSVEPAADMQRDGDERKRYRQLSI
jgi:hypothetical protein